ncbi:DUF2567 domain-containing protein [Streptomyces sp. NBC_01304]|uniref:DUF2567 domain-containing protein n=1 Tax=Streptomyces sp. NBC_01304 TaxID=2903818 RepID=UPI002E114F1F|nr:DUF2567 domain-containing protein [Streptomyces sp. NBC_01304]
MTAPHTPPHQPPPNQPQDPWQAPPPPSGGASYGKPGAGGTAVAAELREGAIAAVAVTIGGVLLGLLWLWLAPKVALISNGEAVFIRDTEGEQAIGADGTFILLGLAFGALSALVVFLLRRRGGIALVVGLAVGGLLASVLAWRFGIWFGPGDDVVARAKAAGEGVAFDAPLKLNALGGLLAWPVAAMAVHLALTAMFGPRDDPSHAYWDRPGPGQDHLPEDRLPEQPGGHS